MNNSDLQRKYKIAVDTTFLFDQYNSRGIGTYGKEVIRRLIKFVVTEPNWEIHLLGFHDLEKNLMQLKFSKLSIEDLEKDIHFHSLGKPTLSSLGNYRRWSKTYKPAIENIKPDIFFAVHFERGLPTIPSFAKSLKHKPKTAVMVHDVIPIILNTYSPKSRLHNAVKKYYYNYMFKGAQNADLVFVPSDLSKKDAIEFGKISEVKIVRIYHGVDPMFFKKNNQTEPATKDAIFEKFKLKNKSYFFYDSGFEANKGIDELIGILKEYFGNAKKSVDYIALTSGLHLKPGLGKEIKSISKLGKKFLFKARKAGILDNVIALGRVTDEELTTILNSANAYLYFSQYEGFGFGPVQAMAAEVPAITANKSCIPEITRDAALLLDTQDFGEDAKKIHKFLSDEQEIKKRIKQGKKVVAYYDWDISAENTWNNLKKLIES